jgi:hypothetical protein
VNDSRQQQGDRFDRGIADSESEDDTGSGDESDTDSDDESSESESEDECEGKRRKSYRKSRSSRKSSSVIEKRVKEENPGRRINGSRKVEDLIKQMSLLATDDPKYGLAYYRALKMDPDVSHIVRKPMIHQEVSHFSPSMSPNKFQSYSQNPPAPYRNQPVFRQVIHYPLQKEVRLPVMGVEIRDMECQIVWT